MTQDEFIEKFAKVSRTTPERLADIGQVAIPCTCTGYGCDGWQMVSKTGPEFAAFTKNSRAEAVEALAEGIEAAKQDWISRYSCPSLFSVLPTLHAMEISNAAKRDLLTLTGSYTIEAMDTSMQFSHVSNDARLVMTVSASDSEKFITFWSNEGGASTAFMTIYAGGKVVLQGKEVTSAEDICQGMQNWLSQQQKSVCPKCGH